MTADDRVKLLHGPYAPPLCRIGDVVFCDVRGQVVVTGLSAGRVPWPMGQRGRAKALVVFAGLADAVRTESNQAVCHWWGVSPQTVSKWRKLLGVPRGNEGTDRLYRDYAPERLTPQVRAKAVKAASTSKANRKKAAARTGKPRPPHVRALLDRTGRKHTAEARARMRAAHRQRQRAANSTAKK